MKELTQLTQQELLEIYGGDGGKKRGIKVGDIIIVREIASLDH